MRILRHRLDDDGAATTRFVKSPNIGGPLEPKYLVIHYTAGRTADESVSWLTSAAAGASAHVVIGRTGTVTQLVPFNRVAWHAGISSWEGVRGLNRHSIGVELDNAGRLERKGGRWCAWFGNAYPDDEVMEATHKHATHACGWHTYPPEQIEAALELSALLIRKYDLLDVLGHEDISPGRKSDPGPAFPMASFRARLLGRSADRPGILQTATTLNIREGPGTAHPKLAVGPLPPGTAVQVLDAQGSWRLVDVQGEAGGENDVQGWVHGGFLRRRD
jgi:N-acetylmuramoyl-L-alanine amidase